MLNIPAVLKIFLLSIILETSGPHKEPKTHTLVAQYCGNPGQTEVSGFCICQIICSQNVRDVVLSPMMMMKVIDIDFPLDVTHLFVNHQLVASEFIQLSL